MWDSEVTKNSWGGLGFRGPYKEVEYATGPTGCFPTSVC